MLSKEWSLMCSWESHRAGRTALFYRTAGRFKCAHTYNMLGMWGADYSLMMTIAFQL